MVYPTIHIHKAYTQWGIQSVAYAVLYGINNQVPDSEEMLGWIQLAQDRALMSEGLDSDPILEGYRAMTLKHGRSLKKFPPSAQALIGIIVRNQIFPRINPLVDIYNTSVVDTKLSIGAHDLDKIGADIYFRFSEGNEKFVAIGGSEKLTTKGDSVYADKHQILAWMDTRDCELVKITPQTTNAILMVKGNANTSLAYRQKALDVLCKKITSHCGGQAHIAFTNVEV